VPRGAKPIVAGSFSPTTVNGSLAEFFLFRGGLISHLKPYVTVTRGAIFQVSCPYTEKFGESKALATELVGWAKAAVVVFPGIVPERPYPVHDPDDGQATPENSTNCS